MQINKRTLLRHALFSLGVGSSAGLASTFFLFALDYVTKTRENHPSIFKPSGSSRFCRCFWGSLQYSLASLLESISGIDLNSKNRHIV